MGWKDWPFWIKIGIIGVIISLLDILTPLSLIPFDVVSSLGILGKIIIILVFGAFGSLIGFLIDRHIKGEKLPFWLKGGIIGALIHLILWVIATFSCWDTGSYWQRSTTCGLSMTLTFGTVLNDFEYFAIPFLIYILLGAMIGWIYGKIKSKGQSS